MKKSKKAKQKENSSTHVYLPVVRVGQRQDTLPAKEREFNKIWSFIEHNHIS